MEGLAPGTHVLERSQWSCCLHLEWPFSVLFFIFSTYLNLFDFSCFHIDSYFDVVVVAVVSGGGGSRTGGGGGWWW